MLQVNNKRGEERKEGRGVGGGGGGGRRETYRENSVRENVESLLSVESHAGAAAHEFIASEYNRITYERGMAVPRE